MTAGNETTTYTYGTSGTGQMRLTSETDGYWTKSYVYDGSGNQTFGASYDAWGKRTVTAGSLLFTINSYIMVRHFLLLLLVLNFISCRNEDTEVNSIKIVNNSNDDVVILLQRDSFYDNPTNEGGYPYLGTRQEYRDNIKYRCINAHSYKYLNNYKIYISELFVTDTLFMGVFNRLDYDTLSREEFKTIYPIKHEYKITLQYMQDQDWTIVYPPISQ